MESILWRAPLVYRSTASVPQSSTSQEKWGILTETHLQLPSPGTETDTLIDLSNVLQAEQLSKEESTIWRLITYPIESRNYVCREYLCECPTAEISQNWVRKINDLLRQKRNQTQQRSLTVLLNPSSGKRKSQKIWQSIATLFEQAQCNLTVISTQDSGDLRTQVRNLDLSTCSGVITVGGDGSIFHAVNGLMSRPDWQAAIALPMGFIPAGTSNGLVKSILDAAGLEYSVNNAAIAILMGQQQPLDLIQVQQAQTRYFSILSLSWGFFSDLDIESDQMKFLGFFKNYLYTVLLLIFYRSYRGTVELKTQNGWQSINQPLITVWIMNVAWAAYNFKPSPKAQLNDGQFDVWITTQQTSRWKFIQILLQAFDGNHLNKVGVDYYKATAMKITPAQPNGIFAVDGEPVNYEPISLEVFPYPLNIFTPQKASQATTI